MTKHRPRGGAFVFGTMIFRLFGRVCSQSFAWTVCWIGDSRCAPFQAVFDIMSTHWNGS